MIYEFSREGQKLAELWIEYYLKRDFLTPTREELMHKIRIDTPSMSLTERENIVKHILEKVGELREVDS